MFGPSHCLLLISPAVLGSGGRLTQHHRTFPMCMFGFEMLIPDANVLSDLKPLCHFPGGCVTECPEGPPLMMLVPPTVNIDGGWGGSHKLWQKVNCTEAVVCDLLMFCFHGQNISTGCFSVGFALKRLSWRAYSENVKVVLLISIICNRSVYCGLYFLSLL